MRQVLELKTIDDLRAALLLQRTTMRKVTLELNEIVKIAATPENLEDDEALAELIMKGEGELLRRYAAMPTLIEFRRSPSFSGVMDGGATFAITTIVGEVLLANVRALCDSFPRAHSTLLFVLLNEIDKDYSEDSDLVDTFVRSLKVELKDVPEQDRMATLRNLLRPLAEAMITVAHHYKLIEAQEEGYTITPFGRRVMLHLFSAQTFIEAVSEAHVRLQGTLGSRSESPQPAFG